MLETPTLPTEISSATNSEAAGHSLTDLVLRMIGSHHDGQLVATGLTKCTIGSSDGCDIVLRSRFVPPLQCLILRGPGGVLLRSYAEDTRVNGRCVEQTWLAPADRISIGPVDLEVVELGLNGEADSAEALKHTADAIAKQEAQAAQWLRDLRTSEHRRMKRVLQELRQTRVDLAEALEVARRAEQRFDQLQSETSQPADTDTPTPSAQATATEAAASEDAPLQSEATQDETELLSTPIKLPPCDSIREAFGLSSSEAPEATETSAESTPCETQITPEQQQAETSATATQPFGESPTEDTTTSSDAVDTEDVSPASPESLTEDTTAATTSPETESWLAQFQNTEQSTDEVTSESGDETSEPPADSSDDPWAGIPSAATTSAVSQDTEPSDATWDESPQADSADQTEQPAANEATSPEDLIAAAEQLAAELEASGSDEDESSLLELRSSLASLLAEREVQTQPHPEMESATSSLQDSETLSSVSPLEPTESVADPETQEYTVDVETAQSTTEVNAPEEPDETDPSSLLSQMLEEPTAASESVPEPAAVDPGSLLATEPAPAAPAPVSPPDSDDDESINDYMNQLLSRLRGGDAAPTSSQPAPPAATTGSPESLLQTAFQNQVAPVATEDETPTAQEEVEYQHRDAPEQNDDIQNFREIANASARNAIQTCNYQRDLANIGVWAVGGTIMGGIGGYFLSQATLLTDPQLMFGIAGLGIGGLAMLRAVCLFGKSQLSSRKAKKAQA